MFASSFREVYLVTMLAKERWVYIPLKMILLWSQFYLLQLVVINHFHDKMPDTIDDYMQMLAAYMSLQTKDVHIRYDEGNTEIIYGNTGTVIREERQRIIDYNDSPLPADIRPVQLDSTLTWLRGAEFTEKEQETLARFTVGPEFAYDVKHSVTF